MTSTLLTAREVALAFELSSSQDAARMRTMPPESIAKALRIGLAVLEMAEAPKSTVYTSNELPPDCKSRRTFAEWCRSRVQGAELHGKVWSCTAEAWHTARKCKTLRTPSIAAVPKPTYDLAAILRANGQRKAG